MEVLLEMDEEDYEEGKVREAQLRLPVTQMLFMLRLRPSMIQKFCLFKSNTGHPRTTMTRMESKLNLRSFLMRTR
jgi:hypothetical protein